MALLGYFVPLWLVIKVTRSVQFQIPDWINAKAPTSSILKHFIVGSPQKFLQDNDPR